MAHPDLERILSPLPDHELRGGEYLAEMSVAEREASRGYWLRFASQWLDRREGKR